MDPLFVRLSDQASQIWKSFQIHRENTISLHVVDVQMESADGQIVADKPSENGANVLRIFITPAALVVSEAPKRRQPRSAGKFCIAFKSVFRRTGDEIIIQIPALETDGGPCIRRRGWVEADCPAVMVFIEDQVAAMFVYAQIDRDGHVNGICFATVATTRIRIPQLKRMAAQL